EAVRVEHRPLIVVAQEDHLALHDQVDALARVGAVADDVAEAVDLGDVVLRDVGQDGLECFEVAVDVADERFHAEDLPGTGGGRSAASPRGAPARRGPTPAAQRAADRDASIKFTSRPEKVSSAP